MLNFFSQLGLSSYDFALMVFCPAGAVLGSFAQVIQVTINPYNPPDQEGVEYIASKKLQEARGNWIALRLMLGGILGIVIGLYFVGAIQENLTTLTKIVMLSILFGYAAPKVWVAQEKIVTQNLIDKADIEKT